MAWTPTSASLPKTAPTSPTQTGKEPQGASPIAPLLRRHAVRPLGGPVLTAIPVVRPEGVTLPDGTRLTAHPGEWMIAQGSQVVDVLSAADLHKKYEPTEKEGLILRGPERSRLERALGTGSTQTPEMLTTAVERLARLRVGDIQVDFTPGQWEEIAHRASKMGLPPAEVLKRLVDRFMQDVWRL